MDRVISLLAALVGLIALAGAVLVHVNNQSREQQLVAEVAALKAQVATGASVQPPPSNDGTIDALLALQKRIAALEQAQATPSGAVAATPSPADAASALSVPAQALAAGGPTTDCIPLGTRFMGTSGDRFPLCKTKMVLKVAAVSDGLATIEGAGDVAQGSTVPYAQGCTVTVFSADTSGYAEMRVACQ